jgi:mannose-6-phosphate isomerase-like protein (cupin superfamily)
MTGYVSNLSAIAEANSDFRHVLYTAPHSQLVVMSLPPHGEIGSEVHTLDQFFRVESGTGTATLDGVETLVSEGFAILVPAGSTHNIVNTGTADLKLYTVYSPPNHRDGVRHQTRADAEADSEHFDGVTTE